MSETYKNPVAPNNVKISEVKVDGAFLKVKATWDHVKHVKVTKNKNKTTTTSSNANEYEARVYIHGGKYVAKPVEGNNTEFEFNLANFYPRKTKLDNTNKAYGTYKIEWVVVKVKSKAKDGFKESPFGASARFNIKEPSMNAPVATETINNDAHSVTYRWDDPTGIVSGFKICKWLQSKSSPKAPEVKDWSYHNDPNLREITVDCGGIQDHASDFHRHVMKIIPYGPQGAGEVKTALHTFGYPAKTRLDSVKRTGSGDNTYDQFYFTVIDTVPFRKERADYFKACWCKGKPSTIGSDRWGEPANGSWQEDDISITSIQFEDKIGSSQTIHTKVKQGYSYPDEDECVFGRIRMFHDEYVHGENQSNPILIACGNPKAPTNISVNATTRTLTWTGATTLPGAISEIHVKHVESGQTINETFEVPITSGTNTYTLSTLRSGTSYDIGIKNRVFCPKTGTTHYSSSDTGDGIVWAQKVTLLPASPENFTVNGRGKANLTWDEPPTEITEIELSWSDDPDAWKSSTQPSTFVIDHKASDWVVNDEKFAEGGVWYFRVRFKNEAGYGSHSEILSLDMATVPDRPLASTSSESIVPGGELVVGWTFENADGCEQEYAVVEYDDGETSIMGADLGMPIDTGDMVPGTTVNFRVRVKGKAEELSEWSYDVPVIVRHPVNAEFTIPEVVTTLPIPVEFGDLGDYVGATLRILSGMTFAYDRPDGRRTIYESGDFIASYSVEDILTSTVMDDVIVPVPRSISPELPGVGTYVAQLTVTDIDGNVAIAEHPFTVRWSEVAALTEDADIEYDPKTMVAMVSISSDEDWSDDAEHGVIDVYRKTVDGYQLIASNVELTAKGDGYGVTIRDPYAPFGYASAAYRIAKRYPNNTVDWLDFEYTTKDGHGMVIDFGEDRLNLPYNNRRSDSWEKPFESRRHLGGSVTGHWQEGVIRTGSYSAEGVKVQDESMAIMVRKLARHPGEAYVRATGGIAYPCDVEVSTDESYGDRIMSFSLSCTQVDSDSWMGDIMRGES